MLTSSIVRQGMICLLVSTTLCHCAGRSSSPGETLTNMDVLDHVRKIEPKDGLTIRIDGDQDGEVFRVVSANGDIECPGLGLIKVTGLTPRQMAFECKAAFEKRLSRRVAVLVMHTHYIPEDYFQTAARIQKAY